MHIEQSKTYPFRRGYTITITFTCPVRALRLYIEVTTPSQDNALVFKGDRFFPLDRQPLTSTNCKTLNTAINITPATALEAVCHDNCRCSRNTRVAHKDLRAM